MFKVFDKVWCCLVRHSFLSTVWRLWQNLHISQYHLRAALTPLGVSLHSVNICRKMIGPQKPQLFQGWNAGVTVVLATIKLLYVQTMYHNFETSHYQSIRWKGKILRPTSGAMNSGVPQLLIATSLSPWILTCNPIWVWTDLLFVLSIFVFVLFVDCHISPTLVFKSIW